MKKIFALAFVAGMVAFASCTSKPAEESKEDTLTTVEAAPDSTVMAPDSMTADSAASDSIK